MSVRLITGYSSLNQAQKDADEMLGNSRINLGTVALTWGLIQHQTRAEWGVIWDDDRADQTDLVKNQNAFKLEKKDKIKTKDEAKADGWFPPDPPLSG